MEPIMSMVQSSRDSFLEVCMQAIYTILKKAAVQMNTLYCSPD
jgi:hypothetical protein